MSFAAFIFIVLERTHFLMRKFHRWMTRQLFGLAYVTGSIVKNHPLSLYSLTGELEAELAVPRKCCDLKSSMGIYSPA